MPSPSKLTPELCEELFDKLRRGHYRQSAAAYVGINKQRLYKWLERGNEMRVLRDQEPIRESFESQAAYTRARQAWRAQLRAGKVYLDFADGLELASDYGEAWLVEKILSECEDKSSRSKWQGYMTILERTRRERWGRRSAVEHGTPDGKPFPVSHSIDPTKLSDEQLSTLKELLEIAQPEQDR